MAPDSPAVSRPPLQAADVVDYLTARQGRIAPGAEEEAFHHLVGRVSFLGLMDIIEWARGAAMAVGSAQLYRIWLDRAPPDAALRYAAYFNLGTELSAAGDRAGAMAAYQAALALKPDFHVAAVNLGLTLEAAGQAEQALELWRRSLQSDQDRVALLNHRGRSLEQLGRLEEAEQELHRSLLTVPQQPDAITHWVHLRLKTCTWPALGEIPGLSRDELVANCGGMTLMSLFDDNAVINRFVETWLARRSPPAPRLSPPQGYDHQRLRIGYLSSDYNLHPVSLLIAELLEKHDRERFEVFGYCTSYDDGSYLRRRVLSAFDQWFRIRDMTDDQAAQLMREHELDILVDLNGLTEGTRMGIIRRRPAPVQVTYLGFVASLPVPELDYAIVDEFVVPPELAGDFHPKPLYMPNCYQVNDSQAPVDPPTSRESVGLPADTFVYCCFSNTYKITEEVFGAWMRILAANENSVLWVLARTPWTQRNLRERAAAHGVAAERLIFASPASPAQYLARLPLADLFLDTYPYNAGTTASDALRMGLPLLTLAGRTFTARMAGSLLRTVGSEATITHTLEDYVALAVQLGRDPEAYRRVRDVLAGGEAWRRTLGNTDRFMRDYEERLLAIRRRPGGN